MAFVFKSKREPSHIKNSISEQIGPGSYVGHSEIKINKAQQPFNSSEPRHKEKDPKNLSPGPGHYQIQKQNINEKVVVSSANEDIKIVEVPKPQSIFKSVTKRFDPQKQNETPGPGAYISQETLSAINKLKVTNHQRQNIIDHLMKANRYQSIPSIPSNLHAFGYTENEQNDLELNKLPQHIHTGVREDRVGPGQYSLKDTFENNKDRAPSWGKYQSKRLAENKSEVPAPGSYDVTNSYLPQYKCKPSMGFASRTVRSMDNRKGMIKNQVLKNSMKSVETTSRGQTDANTNIGDDSDSEWEYVDDATPGPGHYDSQSVISAIKPQAKLEKFQFFGSSSDRFKDQKRFTNVGPQDYQPPNISSFGRQTHPFKVRNPPFLSSNTRFDIRSIEEKKPGPQEYENRVTMHEKLIKKIQKGYRGSFGVTERRFKNASLVDEQPGPGQYLEVIPEQGEKDENQKNAVFKSKAKRSLFYDQKADTKPPVGAYDLSYFNIENKVKKDDEDDEDLRIEKPGFGSELRFDWQKQEKKLEMQKKLNDFPEEEESVSYQKDRNIADLFKKKPKQGAPFGAKGDRFVYKQKDKKPDPGQYYDPQVNTWDKRTYNIHFVKI